MRRFVLLTGLLLSPLLPAGSLQAAVRHAIEPQTGLESWRWESGPVSVIFNQRLPDQSRAYFQGRGFPPAAAERVADSCVFQAIIRNGVDADGPLVLELAEWRVHPAEGVSRPLRLESQWQEEWERVAVPQPARIAFRWSLFPTRQTFQPGDWNMGMITAGLPAGERFDLEVAFEQAGEPQRIRFEKMACAPDRHIQPR